MVSMKSIRKLRRPEFPKKEGPSITKTGKIRKPYTIKNPRKTPSKEYSLNVTLTAAQKLFLENKAEELKIRPAEVVRRILEVFCRDMVLINKLSKDFNIFIDKNDKKTMIDIEG